MRIRAARGSGIAAAALLLLAGCEGDGSPGTPVEWSRVDIGDRLSLELPDGLAPDPERGADSLYRRYTSESLVVSLDYGAYSNPLRDVEGSDLQRESIIVDGRAAVLVTWGEPDAASGLAYVAGLHVPDIGVPGNRLTLMVRGASERDRDRGLRVSRSVRFLEAAR